MGYFICLGTQRGSPSQPSWMQQKIGINFTLNNDYYDEHKNTAGMVILHSLNEAFKGKGQIATFRIICILVR